MSDLNLATLRTWAARRDCPHPFLLQRKENTLLIGTKPNAMFRVQIPMQMEDEMPEIEVPTIKEMPGGKRSYGRRRDLIRARCAAPFGRASLSLRGIPLQPYSQSAAILLTLSDSSGALVLTLLAHLQQRGPPYPPIGPVLWCYGAEIQRPVRGARAITIELPAAPVRRGRLSVCP